MKYLEVVELYEQLSGTTKRLEKTEILGEFFRKLNGVGGNSKWIYLLMGRVVADYDTQESGISGQLAIKAIGSAYGISEEKVVERFRKIGDLGEIAQEFSEKKKQVALFSKPLSVDKVFENLQKVMDVEGKGAVDRKIGWISELLGNASAVEAKYVIRTLLSDLRIGVSSPTIVDALALAFEINGEKVQEAYDLANDFALVFDACAKGEKELEKIGLVPGRPINVMLAVKVNSIDEGFEVVGRPAAIEEKYDGFRVLINKDDKGKIYLFTRKLENVTKQFPDVVSAIEKNVHGKSFILDSEVVGYDSKTGKYKPFESISQRIKRKYDIDKLVDELPVEINVFDCLYLDGKSLINLGFMERRKVVEKIIKEKEKVIRPAVQIVTGDDEKALEFYENALEIGEEGVMMKKIDAPYQQGRRVGYMVKMKPEVNDIDLVIVGAEYGTGKRGGWLTSYIVGCRDGGEIVELGKVSSGLKEKESEGFTFEQMTNLLKPLIEKSEGTYVKVKPEVVVSVLYQNIQESPSYSSGYALRFPRITRYRPDRSVKDIVSLEEIEKEVKKAKR
ncbi:MAG: ATP-dependent DNA ligase [Nanoarchaeota archaeon]